MAKKSRKTFLPPNSESATLVGVQFTVDGTDAQTSTLRAISAGKNAASTSTGRTVHAHLQLDFLLLEEFCKCAAAIHELLGSVSATEQKMQLTGEGQKPADQNHTISTWQFGSRH